MLKPKAEIMKTLGRVYKDSITLQQPTKTSDGQGGISTVFTGGTVVTAYFRKPKVSTDQQTGAVVSEMTREIAIQNRPGVPDVKKGWRILFGAKTFVVEHAFNDDYNREKILIYKENVK